MYKYLDIVKEVLNKGVWKGNRTGVRTLTLPNVHFSHDMDEGFPLLTSKKMATKAMAVELEGFIGGITDKNWYKERGCNIWNEWHSPTGEEDDLGPIYGYQWRRFGQYYGIEYDKVKPELFIDEASTSGDQLANIVHKLKTKPDDRRMVCSAWNPEQIHQMALPPCHLAFVLTHIDGVLNLHWTQRSCDLMLGVPFNIASYALLLELLCKEANLKPGNLSGMLCDCHIYENHIDGAKEQTQRKIYALPKLEILNWNGIFNWTHQDMKIVNYQHAPKISFEVAV